MVWSVATTSSRREEYGGGLGCAKFAVVIEISSIY